MNILLHITHSLTIYMYSSSSIGIVVLTSYWSYLVFFFQITACVVYVQTSIAYNYI